GADGRRLPVPEIARVGSQIARALAAVHAAGLVHRDVKPGNILLRVDGQALLADFGLVHDPDVELTVSGSFVGPMVYAAPEQLRAARAVDGRADIYSLGVTLWEAVAGRLPFERTSSHDLAQRIEAGVIASLRRVAPHVPRDLEAILLRAMEPRAEDRYQNAAA